MFPNINEGNLLNFPVVVPLDPLASYLHTAHRTCQQPRPSFAWILPICNIILSLINADPFYLYDKVLILKCSLFLSNTNTEI